MARRLKHREYASIVICLLLVGMLSSIGLSNIPQAKAASSTVIYAGCRQSSYGIDPFPSPQEWENAIKTMASYWPGSTPAAIWIVGIMDTVTWEKVVLEFPAPDNQTYDYIIFENVDRHENYLDYFDTHGIKVWLQVEPAFADMGDLVDLVLDRYGSHSCVIGFGVDVEWHEYSKQDSWGVKVTDAEAENWEAMVKSHNSSYRLFLKHFWWEWMPPNYRGDIIFVDDSQNLHSLDKMVAEFRDLWAAKFPNNIVIYQYGYEADKRWWDDLDNPPKDIGGALDAAITNDMGNFWVDFTLRDVFLKGGVSHVASIDMELASQGPFTYAKATVTVVNNNDVPVDGATVYGHWENATTDSDSGTTNESGQVTLNSDKVKNAPSGTTFTFVVDNITKEEWTYDPASNVENSDSITVP